MTRPQRVGIALLRVVLGAIYVMHGWHAFAGPGPAETAQVMVGAGVYPSLATPLAWYLIVAHILGGAMLVVGIWTVLAALAQLPIVAGVLLLVQLPQGFFLRGIVQQQGAGQAVAGGYEFSLLVLAATLTIALTGAGALSVDDSRRPRPRTFQIP